MCLLVLAWRVHPRYRLVLAANRDEYHERPTAPLRQVARTERHPRRPGPAGRRHLAGARPQASLRRRDELPRAAAAATLGALPRRARARLPRAGRMRPRPSSPASKPMHRAIPASICCSATPTSSGTPRTGSTVLLARCRPGVYGLSNEFLDTPWPKLRRVRASLRGLAREPVRRSGAGARSACSADREPATEGPPAGWPATGVGTHPVCSFRHTPDLWNTVLDACCCSSAGAARHGRAPLRSAGHVERRN